MLNKTKTVQLQQKFSTKFYLLFFKYNKCGDVTQDKNRTTTLILTTYVKNNIPWLLFFIFFFYAKVSK